MPFSGGTINQQQIEAAAHRRVELQANLRSMEERYNRYVHSNAAHHPDAKYLKQCIDGTKAQLRGR